MGRFQKLTDILPLDDGTVTTVEGQIQRLQETLPISDKINTPPVLDPIGNKVVNELSLLTFTATASDSQSPPQILTFSLSGAPSGASITPLTGVFTWIPTEAQGPGTYIFDVIVSDGTLTDSETIKVVVKEVTPPVILPIPSPSGLISGGGGGGGGAVGGVGIGFGGNITMAVRLYEISYDVCEKNLVTIIAGSDRALSTPFVKIRGIESGVYPARLIVPQPFTELNKVSSISKYVYEAPLTSKDEFFIVTAQLLDVRWTAEASYSVNIYGCKDTIVITEFEDFDTRISEPTIDPNRPQVFDVKYQIGNGTLQISPETSGLFITGDEPITVSGTVYSTSHPTRVELRTITAGGLASEYAAIVMNIEPLDVENAYRVSAEIPIHFMQSPGITFWIQAINEKELIQESKKQTIGVKMGGGFEV